MRRPGYRTSAVPVAVQQYGANLLDAAEQGLETGIGTWVAHDGASAVAQSTDQAKAGSNSLKVTGDGGGTVICRAGEKSTFEDGENYLMECWFYLPADWGATTIGIRTNLSNDTSIVINEVSTVTTWVKATTTFTCGADTAAHILIQASATVSKVFYIDEVYVRKLL